MDVNKEILFCFTLLLSSSLHQAEAQYLKPTLTIQLHEDIPWALTIGRNSSDIASGSLDGRMHVWNASMPIPKATMISDAQVRCLALSSDGRMLVSGHLSGSVILWEVATGRVRAKQNGHKGCVSGICEIAQGLFVTSGRDGAICVWNVRQGHHCVLGSVNDEIYAMCTTSNATSLAIGGSSGKTWIWSMSERKSTSVLGNCPSRVYALALSPDGKCLAIGRENGQIDIWDMKNAKQVAVIKDAHRVCVYCLAFCKDTGLMMSGGGDGCIRSWSWPGLRLQGVWNGHADGVTAMIIDEVGRGIVTCGFDCKIRTWTYRFK